MNNLIYKWLLNNETSIILDIISILSINGLLIEYNSLLNYCNINQNNNQSLYGLNNDQFQTLKNNIQSKLTPLFNNEHKDDITTTSISTTTTIIHYNNIKNKFDCLIAIINDNNNNNNIKTTPATPTIVPTATSKIICSNGIIKNDIDYYFFKVWRNLIIRNEILYHTRLYNIHRNKKFIISPSQLLEYKYKSYITSLELDEEYDELFELEESYERMVLPSELEQFILYSYKYNADRNSFKLNTFQNLHSLTSISLKGDFNQSLNDWIIPSTLKSLEFGSEFHQPIKIGQLPLSLTSLKLHEMYTGIIEYGAIPNSVTDLNYTVDSRNSTLKIPPSTTSLCYDDYFNEVIKQGDIPKNITSLTFGQSFNSEIQVDSLPHSIKTIKFGNYFNQVIQDNVLPPNLTCLTFGGGFINPLTPTSIPCSITSIKFKGTHNYDIPEGLYLHTNLQSLKFYGNCNISVNSLPNTLTHLDIRGQIRNIQDININQILPDSLKSLSLYWSNVNDITSNMLPTNITSIKFNNYFDSGVPIGLISSNLKKLMLNCGPWSSLDVNLSINQLPSTLESLSLNCSDIELLNSIDSNYFHDKIKLLKNKQNV